MTLFALCVSLFFFSNEVAPHKLVLKNGHTIQTMEPYKIAGRLVRFRDLRGAYLSLPKNLVDFKKTHSETKAPPDRNQRDEDGPLREIPWDHPHFKDKTFTIKEIIIDDRKLTFFSRHLKPSSETRKKPSSEGEAKVTAGSSATDKSQKSRNQDP